MAGLSCGYHLQKAGVRFAIVESSDSVGGRVQTDIVDGFLLDRGFQIFLTSYKEAQAMLDYQSLDLKPFYAGALVRWNGAFHRVADPLRHFGDGLGSLPNPVGSPIDKALVGLFRLKSLLKSEDAIFQSPETTTYSRLKAEGFSDAIIDRFFRPFLGGIFFDRDLNVTSRLFEFVMRCLATGQNCLPSKGIGRVGEQLASQLPSDAIHTGTRVESVTGPIPGQPGRVRVEGGQTICASQAVVVATEAPAARTLLGEAMASSDSKSEEAVGTANLYFRAPRPPREENVLYLNGESIGLVNNACFPSTVAPSYAPAGQALVSLSTIGTQSDLSDSELAEKCKAEMAEWFGQDEVATWQLLRVYRIPFAQPNQTPPTDFSRAVNLTNGLFVCGDHRDTATLDGALKSGRRAAEAVLAATAALPVSSKEVVGTTV
ncbi:g7140 [Coccomyxa viridis]|uniref:G7140 protein n=1 Tax=Coccomyxa viridis TaxID=1274662 RepID=A0ABP1FZJ0_9CHLO